jgi:hypothetical protein
MPISPTYPGVYVQELPSSSRAISGVSTSATAFIGSFSQGPANVATEVLNLLDFTRTFGGLNKDSPASYAVQQYFLNGGEIAWIVRTAKSDDSNPWSPATVTCMSPAGSSGGSGSPVLLLSAANPGTWGNNIQVDVNYNTTDPTSLFNLTATVYSSDLSKITAQQSWQQLTMDQTSAQYAPKVVKQTASTPILLTDKTGAKPGGPTLLPAQTGTVGGNLTPPDQFKTKFSGGAMTVTLTVGTGKLTDTVQLAPVPNGISGLQVLASSLQAALRAVPWMANATVLLITSTGRDSQGKQTQTNQLRIVLGDPKYADGLLTFSAPPQGKGSSPQNLSTLLMLDKAVTNVQAYSLGVGTKLGAQQDAQPGADGLPPTTTELVGSITDRTGLYALDAVDVVNILAIPSMKTLDSDSLAPLLTTAIKYCEQRYAMLLVDLPATVTTPQQAMAWMQENATLASANAAVYFPNLVIADPLNGYLPLTVAPSGTIAGLYARTDNAVGVWKAPAGVGAKLTGVTAVSYKMTDQENGLLNPAGVNALRNLPVYGNVCWGARTTVGNDKLSSEWKYVPVKRLALYIEESLLHGLQWVVFEPNDEPLWSSIRLNVGTFMNNLYLAGAFQGTTTREAYFVNCDSSTTTQTDIDAGVVNVVVGFAPVKPAEFVIISIQQKTGQSGS